MAPSAVPAHDPAAPPSDDAGATHDAAPIDAAADEAGGFAELALRPELLRPLAALGYEEPTPIQREAIPPLLAGRDVLGQAATGTGKTAAFALPVLQRMPPRRTETEPIALVLVPTRELAVQVSQAFHRYGRDLGARILPIYGGQPIGRQLATLKSGVDVVVATPGRALDHIARGTLHLSRLETVVLDEADEMLDMGFAEDIESILDNTPEDRQTVLFSATMPARIDGLVRRYLRNPVRIQMGGVRTGDETPLVRQSAYVVARAYKPAALGRILDVEAPAAALVFCRTREEVDQLSETLNGRGYRAEALHGGMSQEQRDRVMGRLRAGTADLIVATDVAARGLDIEQLTHVINYDVPSSTDAYVHRIGRVGRAGREGVAITLAEPREHRMLKTIERATKQRIAIEKVPTVADLRTRRLEMTRAALHETLMEGDLERFRVVVETLTDEFDVMEVALAAVKLAHEAGGGSLDEEEDIPQYVAGAGRDGRPRRAGGEGGRPAYGTDDGRPSYGGERGRGSYSGERGRPAAGGGGPSYSGERGRSSYGGDASSGAEDGRTDAGGGEGRGFSGGGRRERPAAGGLTRIFVGLGRRAGIRPQDLVGAIAGESRVRGNEIGSIEITDRFSLVEVPQSAAEEVISALRATTIKGRKATVRRDRDT